MLLLSCPVLWCGSCPTHPTAVLASTAVRVVHRSLPGVRRVGSECASVLFSWWGILCPLPPRRGGGWGHRGWWGVVVVVGGMVRKGGWCDTAPPVLCVVSPFCLRGGPVEWREWRVLCCLVFGLGPPLHIVRSPRIVPVPLLSLCSLLQH